MSTAELTGPDFDHLCAQVRARSGLVLGPDKAYLVASRLDSVARAAGLASVPALLSRLRADASDPLVERCVEALATHESSFFRDAAPFERLATEILPALIARRRSSRSLRIWCAACAAGQEPYSLAMLLLEQGAALAGWRLEILATDLSRPILARARAGLYSSFEARRGLSPERLQRWFAAEGEGWRVVPKVQALVSFREHNLLSGTAGLGVFDLILCRNVLIYFDSLAKAKVLDGLALRLAPDGALLLGGAETVLGLSSKLCAAEGGRGLYRLASAAAGESTT